MKLYDKQTVDGTAVVIGRRAQYRRDGNQTVERISRGFTAIYTGPDGRRRFETLETTSVREARRKAIEIQRRLDDGLARPKTTKLTIEELIDAYNTHNDAKDLAPRTLAKYRTDLDKLRAFSKAEGIRYAAGFDETAFYRFGAWLREAQHKQKSTYKAKTVYTAMTITKQAFNFAVRKRLLVINPMPDTRLPSANARPQTCPTAEQVDQMINLTTETTRTAIILMAFAGLRVGEVAALCWEDVLFDRGELGVLHIRRGGSTESTKSRRSRVIPMHDRVRTELWAMRATTGLVLPELRERTLLTRVRKLGQAAGVNGQMKSHSFRHFFASTCANRGVPLRLAMTWMGHTSSSILNLYYHLTDTESAAAMATLAISADRPRA